MGIVHAGALTHAASSLLEGPASSGLIILLWCAMGTAFSLARTQAAHERERRAHERRTDAIGARTIGATIGVTMPDAMILQEASRKKHTTTR
jgi:hypothetical protein